MTDARPLALALLLLLPALACDDGDRVRVRLAVRTPPDFPVYSQQVEAQVSGPVEGLRYRWYSGTGQAEPQESSLPSTVFTFANGTTRDRVSVDVWRGDVRVAHDEIAVQLDTLLALPATAAPALRVAITRVPPFDSVGGDATRDTLIGRVEGTLPTGARAVVFARADLWYIQPHPDSQHAIARDGTFGTWTHTGSSYAVLVVQPGFFPLPRYDVLPVVGGPVLARIIVEGAR